MPETIVTSTEVLGIGPGPHSESPDQPPVILAEDPSLVTHNRLLALERVISTGLTAYIKVGEALLEISESNLYLQSYPTFDEYVSKRWNMERRTAYNHIAAYKVAKNLSENLPASPLPNETQAIQIARIKDPKAQLKLVKGTKKNPGLDLSAMSVKAVQDHVDKVLGKGSSRTARTSAAPAENTQPANLVGLTPEKQEAFDVLKTIVDSADKLLTELKAASLKQCSFEEITEYRRLIDKARNELLEFRQHLSRPSSTGGAR